jgi:hypothetical protein
MLVAKKTGLIRWLAVGMIAGGMLNVVLAVIRVTSTGASLHQTWTDLLYFGMTLFGLAGTVLGLHRATWRPPGWLWRLVATVVVLGMLGGLQYVHAWSNSSLVHYDRGFPFPWIKGATPLRSQLGVPGWHLAYRGLAADLLVWGTLGYALAALAARVRNGYL